MRLRSTDSYAAAVGVQAVRGGDKHADADRLDERKLTEIEFDGAQCSYWAASTIRCVPSPGPKKSSRAYLTGVRPVRTLRA